MVLFRLLRDLWAYFKHLLLFLLAWAIISGLALIALYYTGNLEIAL